MINFAILNTVSVVQLVERQIVVLVVVGSSPTVHPPWRSCIARSLFFYPVPLSADRTPHCDKAQHGLSCNSPDSGYPATDTCRPGVACRSPSFGVTW